MDDPTTTTANAAQPPFGLNSQAYLEQLDMMKVSLPISHQIIRAYRPFPFSSSPFAFPQRQMDSAVGQDAVKKARWSPTNGQQQHQQHQQQQQQQQAQRQQFDNYGYGSFSQLAAAAGPTLAPPGAQQGPPQPSNAQLLHSGAAGPALTLNTSLSGIPQGPGSAISPSAAQGGLGGGVSLAGNGHHQNGHPMSAYPQSAFPSLAAAYQMSSLMGMSPLSAQMLGSYGFSPAVSNFQQV